MLILQPKFNRNSGTMRHSGLTENQCWEKVSLEWEKWIDNCLLYTSPSPRDQA